MKKAVWAVFALFLFFVTLYLWSYHTSSVSDISPNWGEEERLTAFTTLSIDVDLDEGVANESGLNKEDLMRKAISAVTELSKRHINELIKISSYDPSETDLKNPLNVNFRYRVFWDTSNNQENLISKMQVTRTGMFELYLSSLIHPDAKSEFDNLTKQEIEKLLADDQEYVVFTIENKVDFAQLKNFEEVVKDDLRHIFPAMNPEYAKAVSIERSILLTLHNDK